MNTMKYWLMKCEPDVYSIDDLEREGRCFWEGVRNYQARNFMRDEMREGDLVIFYHSNAKPSGAAGVAKVAKESYPDFTALDPSNKYYDPKSSKDKPIWYMVDLAFVEKFTHYLPLSEIREIKECQSMKILEKGSRLSITPCTELEFKTLRKAGQRKALI